MTDIGSLAQLLNKAERALISAKVLLQDGDADDASSRAYYVMHDAARAALLFVAPDDFRLPKTHGALISAFSEHVVKPGSVPATHGRELNSVHQLRLVADYAGEGRLT